MCRSCADAKFVKQFEVEDLGQGHVVFHTVRDCVMPFVVPSYVLLRNSTLLQKGRNFLNTGRNSAVPDVVFDIDATIFVLIGVFQDPLSHPLNSSMHSLYHTLPPHISHIPYTHRTSSLPFLFSSYILSRLRPHWPPPRRQRNPPPNQTQPSQRRNRPQKLKPLRIQHKQIYRAREHGHAGGEESHCECVLRRDDGGECEDGGVDEL